MKRGGFTLFEAMVTVAIFSLALLVLSQLFASYRGLGSRVETESEPLLEARRALQLMLAEAQGALEVVSPVAGSSATSLQLKVVEPGADRFPVGPGWSPLQASVDVTYTVTAQGLTRIQAAQPGIPIAVQVQGMEVLHQNDHRLDIRFSVNLGGTLRSLKSSAFYWVKSR